VAWNAQTQPDAVLVMTENTTISAPSNSAARQFIVLEVTQAAGSAYTLAWNAVFKGTIPALTTTLGARMTYSFRRNAANTAYDYFGSTEAIS
jgi:hypothetical protein